MAERQPDISAVASPNTSAPAEQGGSVSDYVRSLSQ